MKVVKLFSDWMVVEEEAAKTHTSGGLVIVHPEHAPIRTAKVLMAGPGRRYTDKFIPMPEDIVGQRVLFMIGASYTKQGQQINIELPDGQRFIRYGDVLGLVDGDVEVTK